MHKLKHVLQVDWHSLYFGEGAGGEVHVSPALYSFAMAFPAISFSPCGGLALAGLVPFKLST